MTRERVRGTLGRMKHLKDEREGRRAPCGSETCGGGCVVRIHVMYTNYILEDMRADERAYARPWASPTTARVPAGLKALARRTPSSVILFCACGL